MLLFSQQRWIPIPLCLEHSVGSSLERGKSPARGATGFEDILIAHYWFMDCYLSVLWISTGKLQKSDIRPKSGAQNPIFKAIFIKRHELRISAPSGWRCRASYPDELSSTGSPGSILSRTERRLPIQAMFPHRQEDSRLGLQMHQIPVTFSRVLAVGLGKFPPLFRPAGMGLLLEEGWKWSRALLTGGEARCEISHGQTSESCGVPRRRGTEKMKRGGGE